MTRHRKGLRPLSQRGFNRLPLNPKQRQFREGGVREPRAASLDAYNETLEEGTMHPTKGYRKINFKRLEAQAEIARITFRAAQPKKGPTPNRYVPHIGAKQRAKALTA